MKICLLALVLAQPSGDFLTYEEGYAEAKRTGKPLVLFVGVPARDVRGAVVAVAKTYASHDGYHYSKSVFVIPAGLKVGHWKDDATDDEIRELMTKKAVQPMAVPFSGKQSVQRIADDKSEAIGLWQKEEQNQNTQEISADQTATIRMTVPENARIWFDGEPTKLTGSSRTFKTPRLGDGQYSQEVLVKWVKNGKEQVFWHTFTLRAGSDVSLVVPA